MYVYVYLYIYYLDYIHMYIPLVMFPMIASPCVFSMYFCNILHFTDIQVSCICKFYRDLPFSDTIWGEELQGDEKNQIILQNRVTSGNFFW